MFSNLRIGHGYDVHRLVEGRRCIIGGVDIPYERGLLGHSDADVLAHALADAFWAPAAGETSANCSPTPILPMKVPIRWCCLPV